MCYYIAVIDSTLPHIGQIVDFYPSNVERNAAMVVEVHPIEDGLRPEVNLQVFKPDGKVCFIANVPPVDVQSEGYASGDTELKGNWAFAHEMSLETELDDLLGSQSNEHVGQVTLD